MNDKRAENKHVQTLQDIFVDILRAELNETELDVSIKEKLTLEVVSALFALSKHHDLAHVISSCLYKNGVLTDKELLAKYRREEIASIYRYEQMKYAYEQICSALDDALIPYVPLKGSIIRAYFPNESMRTSCDIDILINEQNLDLAIQALVKKEYTAGDKNYHDVSLYSPTNVHLELHFSIQENNDKLDEVLKDAWGYAKQSKGSCYVFTNEFFIFHMFAHMSYHFLEGGCGIRSLMDVWVMEHKMGLNYSQAQTLLERAGIYKFATEMSKLANICFSNCPKNEFTDTLLFYILNGGVYGSEENNIAMQKGATKSTFGYSLKRLFMPYKNMVVLYPILKKLPFLLPFCWVARFFKMLFKGKMKKAVKEIKTAQQLSNDDVQKLKQMKERLQL